MSMADGRVNSNQTISRQSTNSSSGRIFSFSSVDKDQLEPAPIRQDWVIDGSPVAMCKILARHHLGWGDAAHWSCTAGKFHWYYGWDETVMFLEGEVFITDDNGNVYHGRPGVSLHFPKGTGAIWEVPTYIRKLAFNQKPVPSYLHYPHAVIERMQRVLNKLIG
ncbi:cupin domain-containing protein [uncultured Roseibium sp.]|uniref:cupin domain-containing protein n=1 Tax=uncultured Roseibium sp. TaxID=1936171 RepID=UPI0026135F7C|nr:cupin domain-containing protein [uncultured Roseibium sp.]